MSEKRWRAIVVLLLLLPALMFVITKKEVPVGLPFSWWPIYPLESYWVFVLESRVTVRQEAVRYNSPAQRSDVLKLFACQLQRVGDTNANRDSWGYNRLVNPRPETLRVIWWFEVERFFMLHAQAGESLDYDRWAFPKILQIDFTTDHRFAFSTLALWIHEFYNEHGPVSTKRQSCRFSGLPQPIDLNSEYHYIHGTNNNEADGGIDETFRRIDERNLCLYIAVAVVGYFGVFCLNLLGVFRFARGNRWSGVGLCVLGLISGGLRLASLGFGSLLTW